MIDGVARKDDNFDNCSRPSAFPFSTGGKGRDEGAAGRCGALTPARVERGRGGEKPCKNVRALVDHLSKFAAGKEHLAGDLGATTSDTVPDGDIATTDLQLFNGAFGTGGNYNEDADLITDGSSEDRIDAEDVFEFGRNYGATP